MVDETVREMNESILEVERVRFGKTAVTPRTTLTVTYSIKESSHLHDATSENSGGTPTFSLMPSLVESMILKAWPHVVPERGHPVPQMCFLPR